MCKNKPQNILFKKQPLFQDLHMIHWSSKLILLFLQLKGEKKKHTNTNQITGVYPSLFFTSFLAPSWRACFLFFRKNLFFFSIWYPLTNLTESTAFAAAIKWRGESPFLSFDKYEIKNAQVIVAFSREPEHSNPIQIYANIEQL